MEYPEFSNLQFGKIYYCYNPQNDVPSSSLLTEIEEAIRKTFENYKAALLPTTEKTNGMLVVRRFNLGVACNYGVVAVPISGYSLAESVRCLTSCMLDVSSFRSDPVLFLNQHSLSSNHPVLDDCSTSIDGISSTCKTKPFYKFWTNLRANSSDVPLLERKMSLDDIIIERYETHKSLSRRALEELGGIIGSRKSQNEELSSIGSLTQFELDSSNDVCYEVQDNLQEEREAADAEVVEEQQTEEILVEKEALAKQIALLIKTYILKYGAIDDEKIQCMLTGKMTLSSDKLSHLMVNNDCKIVLQDYNETLLKVGGPLPTSLYILFLRHPEGILLKDIGNYRKELMDIYCLVANKTSSESACVNQITTPTDPRINQEISRIRRAIKAHIPVGDLADKYSIVGERGKIFYIPIARQGGFVTVAPKF